jgi:hypothetical protein
MEEALFNGKDLVENVGGEHPRKVRIPGVPQDGPAEPGPGFE